MLEVGSDEARLYREAVMQTGFRYQLLRVEETPLEAYEAGLISGLYKVGILFRR